MLHSYQGLREIVLELVEGYECRTVFWRTNTLIQTWGYRPAISKRFPLEILAEFGLEGPGVSIASGGCNGMPFLPLYYTVDDVDVFAADWERYILHYPATSIQQLVFLGGMWSRKL